MGFSKQVKESIIIAQNYYCYTKGCLNEIHSIHHKLHDIKHNRKKYPLFINSPMNGVGLCFNCHTNKYYKYSITDSMAEVYESWLEDLKGGVV